MRKMRERAHPRAPFAGLIAACLIGFGAHASGEDEVEENLPPKARTVALKFELYQETASAEEVEVKRKQVIDYLGELLKQEAAAADLDGALAVRALIERLEDQAPAAAAERAEGLAMEAFSIGRESERRLEFPFTVARDSAAKSLRCEIAGASDDTGDGGLEYELLDPRGKVVKQGFLSSSGLERVVHKTRIGGVWKFVLIDADTVLEGEYPGNRGSLRITVTRGEAALASNRDPR